MTGKRPAALLQSRRSVTATDGFSPLFRLAKEEASYKAEAKEQEEKIEQLKAAEADVYLIKQHMASLQETIMIIPDTRRRMTIAHGDLQQLLEAEEELSESEEYQEAKNVLDSVKLDV
ncbi:tubulin-specific chaperone A isoform X1 [Syngnathus typhle]|uniref:tubulin-specific chaperone A isoform X1 n=1 Tax=Syngnathus typhle TaxID=161592 RepID=UPI002A6A73EE|nr:tubulin-specific chaperone A isoform X1 [Syngnathus typhle]